MLPHRLPDGNEVERFLLGRQVQRACERGIVEGANRYGAKAQGRSFEQEVLCGMADLDVHAARATLRPVLGCRSLVDRCHQEHRGCATDPWLTEGSVLHRDAKVCLFQPSQPMASRDVVEEAGRRRHVELERIQGSGRGAVR